MLQFNHVTFQYEEEDFNIIDDLSFQVDQGDFISIIGISGCGKSTIFRLINKLLPMKSGEILINQEKIENLSGFAGSMPQKDLLFPWRTIEKNLCLPMEMMKVPKKEQRERAEKILEDVGLLDYKDKYPKDLSGGMRQRISFARTLLTNAELMLLDEPFSALDALTRISMQEWLLSQWKKYNKTILFITHDVEEAIFLSNKIYLVPETPIHRLEVVEVPMEYPRKREFLKRPEINEMKEILVERLRKQQSM